MRATQVITVITNFACQETITNGVRSNAIIPQVSPIETGPILDVISSLMPDGHTIHLNTTALWTDFLGYRHPTHPTRMAYTPSGEKVDVPVILPQFDLKKMTESMSLGDNQTLVLGGVISSKTFGMSDEVPVLGDIPLLGKLFQKNSQSVEKKELLVLITATIVDSAGNRVYPDDTLTVAQGSAAK
jgi:general secretion pathway protein D